jgi:hypothetical protein
LAADDRITYEALAGVLAERLDSVLPPQAIWPRSRVAIGATDHRDFTNAPAAWSSEYVVVADIESFYESISHARLIFSLDHLFGLTDSYLLALEGFLLAVMASDVGLPQGPPGSEMFASAFLGQVDVYLAERGFQFVRYNDDFLIAASSMADGRKAVETLEELLRDVGLRLSPTKTKLMRRGTYLDGLSSGSRALMAFRARLREQAEEMLRESDDAEDVGEYLRDIGVDEEILFDLLYHGTTTIEEIIEESRQLLDPELIELYDRYLSNVAEMVRSGRYEDDAATEQGVRDSLIGLAGAHRVVADRNFVEVLSALPRLARYFSLYLAEVANVAPDFTMSVVRARLDPPLDTDWVNSWICSVLERRPALVDSSTRKLLVSFIRSDSTGSLLKTVAIRTLAASGNLTREIWIEALSRVSQAVRSELSLTAWSDRERYPLVPNDKILGSKD